MNYSNLDYQGGGGGFGGGGLTGGGGFGGGGTFGGGGGGYGGGFNNNNNDSYSPPNSAGGGGGGRTRRSSEEQTIQPVTISMILSAKQDPRGDGSGQLQLDDERSLHHVKFVGAIRSFEESSVNMIYSVEDGTGLVNVKQWINQDECSAMVDLREGTKREHSYVKIVGQVKEYDGSIMVLADSIRPLTTGNQLTHHMLEVVYAAEQAKRKGQYVVAPQGVGFSGAPAMRGQALSSSSSIGAGGQIMEAVRGFMRVESEKSEEGASIEMAQHYFRGKFSESQVRETIEQLAADGALYTTGDEDHYKFAT